VKRGAVNERTSEERLTDRTSKEYQHQQPTPRSDGPRRPRPAVQDSPACGAAARGFRGRDETCPVSTEGGTRRVQLVREGGGGVHLKRAEPLRRPGDGRVSGGRAGGRAGAHRHVLRGVERRGRRRAIEAAVRRRHLAARRGEIVSAPAPEGQCTPAPLLRPPTNAAVCLHSARSARARAHQALRAVLVNHDAARAERDDLP